MISLILRNGFTRNPHSFTVQFRNQLLTMIVSHRDTLATEGIGRNNISPCLQVPPVNILNDIRPCQRQNVIITLHLSGNIQKPVAPEILLRKMIALDHGTHGTVQQHQLTTS